MKHYSLCALFVLLLSVVIAVGSVSFLGPCVHDDGSFGACHWAGRALLGLGCLLAVLSVLTLLSGRARFGTYLSGAAVSVLGILTPGTLISLCRMDSMHCRAVMQPAMIILFAASGLIFLTGALLCAKTEKRNK